jgi:hypothetical protein
MQLAVIRRDRNGLNGGVALNGGTANGGGVAIGLNSNVNGGGIVALKSGQTHLGRNVATWKEAAKA